jgi:hypothetical protein
MSNCSLLVIFNSPKDFSLAPFCTILKTLKTKEYPMTIEQMVAIPANRLICIELPPYIPEGKATIAFSVTPVHVASPLPERKAWRSFRGMFKDSGDTTADFLERMRADRELEDELEIRHASS